MDTNRIINKVTETLGLPLDAAIEGTLVVGGNTYELQTFETEFQQDTDFKGQPQNEIKGGLLYCTFKYSTDPVMHDWMFRRKEYDGVIILAPKTRLSDIPIRIEFKKGKCIHFEKTIGRGIGLVTRIGISPEELMLNGIEHTNLSTSAIKKRKEN